MLLPFILSREQMAVPFTGKEVKFLTAACAFFFLVSGTVSSYAN